MNRHTINRRDAIKRTIAGCLGTAVGGHLLAGCGPGDAPPPCEPSSDDPPIGWAPNVMAPVFYGYADYNPSVGAPANLRVYYPSLDGAPHCAPFLTGPGRFPLVLFLHGQCSASEHHYTRWSRLPAGLARAGFIVAIPDLGGLDNPWDLGNPTYTLISDVIDWITTTWSRRKFVMGQSKFVNKGGKGGPLLGIVGHSYGALFGGRLATTIATAAYVSVGGAWSEWPGSPANPLKTLTVAKLFARGTGFSAFVESLDFGAVQSPKHRLVFSDAEHWDYVPAADTLCDSADSSDSGPCNLVDDLVADFTALFLTKHMPPEAAAGTGINAFIPDNLVAPAVLLTEQQSFFASGNLASFGLVATHAGCSMTLDWETAGGSGSRSLP